jgi:hypothetical protein
MPLPFDVFFSYHRTDAAAAARLKTELELMGLSVFLDADSLRPGIDWQQELEQALRNAPAIAVLIGPDDVGPTQEREVRTALDLQVASRTAGKPLPVIPVILPGAQPSTRVTFMNQNTWINLGRGFENPSELDRLYYGISGQQRVRPKATTSQPTTAGPTSAIDDVVKNLVPRLGEGGVSFFLGGGVSYPPTPHELAMSLTDHLRANNPGVPDIPTLDLAGSCYAVDRGGEELAVEDSIREFLALYVKQPVPPVHETVARLAQAFGAMTAGQNGGSPSSGVPGAYPEMRRSDQQNTQPLVIVCTTYDLAMERALLREGVAFVRLVQNHAKRAVDVAEFDVIREANSIKFIGKSRDSVVIERQIDRDSRVELLEAIAAYGSRQDKPGKAARRPSKVTLAMSRTGKVPGVVLYKPLGSRDVLGSCFISSDHHVELILQAKAGGIPEPVTEIVRNNRIVFLGYGFFDPILRLLRHTLLLNRTWSVPSYIVKTPPVAEDVAFDARLEAALWRDVRVAWPSKGMTLVEAAESEFLESLLRQFSVRYGGAHA